MPRVVKTSDTSLERRRSRLVPPWVVETLGVVVKAVGYFDWSVRGFETPGPQPLVPRVRRSDAQKRTWHMATINKKAADPKTHEGAPARRLTPLETLRRSVLACLLWEDAFYEDGEQIGDGSRGSWPR